ncbi:hypothetical protein [Streptomyces sp. 8K308]|uniref:hypothetical protein n=1 Tax=Streptomyces sp. 8K308 TaxID=2530388 RepID=UPI001FB5DA22|nr:hypothetical protein [Streptomyces sp. 8K308]
MPNGVGQRLLHDPVGRRADHGRDVPLADVDGQRHRGARRLGRHGQVGQPADAGRRAAALRAVAAQHPQRGAQFGACLAAGLGDAVQLPGQCGPVEPTGVGGEEVGGDGGADADQRDAVRQQIVQVAGDAQPLLRDAARGLLLSGALGPFGAFAHRREVLAVQPERLAEDEHGEDPSRGAQRLEARLVAREHPHDEDGDDDRAGHQDRPQVRPGQRDREEGERGDRERREVGVVQGVVGRVEAEVGDQHGHRPAAAPDERHREADHQQQADQVEFAAVRPEQLRRGQADEEREQGEAGVQPEAPGDARGLGGPQQGRDARHGHRPIIGYGCSKPGGGRAPPATRRGGRAARPRR